MICQDCIDRGYDMCFCKNKELKMKSKNKDCQYCGRNHLIICDANLAINNHKQTMTEQELRDEFESLGYIEQYRYDLNKNESGNYTSNDTFKLWRGFCLGHLLAQETIAEIESRLEQSVDIGVVNQLNETIEKQKKEIDKAVHIIQGILGLGGIATRLAVEPKAKAWLEQNK